MAHPEWKKRYLWRWGTKDKAGLSFDFVALRDIESGEEITIDYGSEWEDAWQEHLRSFYDQKTDNNNNEEGADIDAATRETLLKRHVPAFELNKLVDLKLYTLEERDYESVGLRLFCRKPYLEWSGVLRDGDDDNNALWVTGSSSAASKNRSTNRQQIKRNDYTDWGNYEVYPCRIRNRYRSATAAREGDTETDASSSYRYTVEVFERSDEVLLNSGSQRTTQDLVWAVVLDAPRDAFYFEDQAKQRHHHRSWSFRHDMRIPDEMFPSVWRNKNKK